MSSVNTINASVDSAVASVKQQIMFAQQNTEQQKLEKSTVSLMWVSKNGDEVKLHFS